MLVSAVIATSILALVAGLAVGRSAVGSKAGRAQDVLDERYAAGELTTAEYEERRALLHDSARQRQRSPAMILALMCGAAGVILAILVVIAAATWGISGWWPSMNGHMGWTSNESTAASSAEIPDAEVIRVEAGDLWFEPKQIEVRAGEPVNLRLDNSGRLFHDFNIAELGFDLNAQPGDSTTGGLLIETPGSYEYRCTVPGHAGAGMKGTITASA